MGAAKSLFVFIAVYGKGKEVMNSTKRKALDLGKSSAAVNDGGGQSITKDIIPETTPPVNSQTQDQNKTQFVPLFDGCWLPVQSVRIDGVTYTNRTDDTPNYDGTFGVYSLRAGFDDSRVHLTGFVICGDNLYRWWRLTHRGAYTVVWPVGAPCAMGGEK